MADFDFSVNTVFIGAPGVGKTSVLNYICERSFFDSYVPTIGIDVRIII